MFACLYVPDFPVQAILLSESEHTREALRQSPIVVLDGPASLPRVASLNDPARQIGIEIGMTKLQVETCTGILTRKRSSEMEESAQIRLLECANAFSPAVESTLPGTVILDLSGMEKLLGGLESIGRKLSATAGDRGFDLHIAIASNPDTAFYAARGFAGITVILAGHEARSLARLNVNLLPATREMLEILKTWGIHTFQSLAALPTAPLSERLGQAGLHLQKLARGELQRELVPTGAAAEFIECYEFDDPVETSESLAFVLNRLLQQVCARLGAYSLATNELRLTLDLEVRQRRDDNSSERYWHEWKLPVPTQDGRMLLALIRLDLERNTFSAPIRKVTVEAVPIRPRMAQGNLFAPPSPEAEKLEITLARIRGVVGCIDAQGQSCVGAPAIVDTHRPLSFSVQPFSSAPSVKDSIAAASPVIAFRVFRPALETCVELDGGTPHLVRIWKKYRHVLASSGPWHSSGNWWSRGKAWAREEWDVALKTSAGTGFYRIYRDQLLKQWFVEGIFD